MKIIDRGTDIHTYHKLQWQWTASDETGDFNFFSSLFFIQCLKLETMSLNFPKLYLTLFALHFNIVLVDSMIQYCF